MVGRSAVWVPLLALLAVAFAGVVVDETLHTQEISFTVERVYGGAVLNVAFVVDINDDMTVTVNDADLPYGVSNVQVDATLSWPNGDAKEVNVEIELDIQLEQLSSYPVVHRTTIKARIVEIAGESHNEVIVVEQVFDVHSDGKVIVYELTKSTDNENGSAGGRPGHPGCPGHPGRPGHHGSGRPGHHGSGRPGQHGSGRPGQHGSSRPGHHGNGGNHPHTNRPHGNHHNNPIPDDQVTEPAEIPSSDSAADVSEVDCSEQFWAAVNTASEWLHSLPFALRLLITLCAGFATGIVFVVVVRVLLWVFTCGRVPCCPHKRAAAKNAEANYALNILAHSGAYVAVPADEKAAKKAEDKAALV